MRPGLIKTVLGGLAGTLVMTLMMYVVSPMMGVRMDIAASLGSMLGASWSLGMMMHFINGTIVFPLFFAFLFFGLLPSRPVTKGISFGMTLWILAQVMVMPMMGGGLFSSKMGGMMAVIGSLIGHFVYGGVLGWIAGAATNPAAVRSWLDRRAA